MPEAWTESLQQFAWEGRLSLVQLGCIGALASALLIFFAWRESQLINRPRAAWALLGLRLATLLLVLWALAEPTDVLTQRKHEPKTVGIFLDTSASMTLVDPGDESGDRQRWQEALETDGSSMRVLLDEAHGALVAAAFSLRHSKAAAVEAVERALSHLDNLRTGSLDLSSEELGQIDALRKDFADTLFPAIRALPKRSRPTLADKEAVEKLRSRLEQHADRLRLLTDLAYERAESRNTEPGAATRLEKAVTWLENAEEQWIEKLGEDVRVQRYRFDREAVALGRGGWSPLTSFETEPERGTDASSWMKQVNRLAAAQQLDAVLVVSDGVHNTGDSPRELAPSLKGLATVLVPIGDTRLRRDVFLHHVNYPQSVIQKDTLVVEGIVTAHDCQGEKLVVQLVNGRGETLDQQVFEVAQAMEDHRVTLRWRAMELGRHDLKLRVKPVVDEFSEENNAEEVKVHVIDDELRILLADRLPRWEYRYLKSILQRDRKIHMDDVLFKPQHGYRGRRIRPDMDLPRTLEEWSRYRVALLGDLTPSELTPAHQAVLRQWVVEAGGNLILIAGDSMPAQFFNSPVGELFPVEKRRANIARSGYQLTVTAEGTTAPPVLVAGDEIRSLNVWERVSAKLPVYDLSPYSIPKPTAHVLIQADWVASRQRQALSFLCWQYVGKGRVVYLSAPVSYQLRYRKGDEYHHRFWGQLFRWAIARDLGGGSRTVKLSTDKTRYPYRSDVSVRLRLNELNGLPVAKAAPQLMVKSDGELVQTVSFRPDRGMLGVYRALLTDLPPGKIELEARGPAIQRLLREEKYRDPIVHDLMIDPHDSAELRVPLADAALLRSIADASEGVVAAPASVEEILTNLELSPITSESVSRQPLWNRWLCIWLILALLLAEWIGRKALGLV